MNFLRKLGRAGYNTVCVSAGLWVLTDDWNTFFGYMLIAEGFLSTIEHVGNRLKVTP